MPVIDRIKSLLGIEDRDRRGGSTGGPGSGDPASPVSEPVDVEVEDIDTTDVSEAEPAESGVEDGGTTTASPDDGAEGGRATGREADAEAAGESSGESPGGSDEPVTAIKGIGPAYSQRLETAGVSTVGDLAAADSETLADEMDVSEARIAGWIERAREY